MTIMTKRGSEDNMVTFEHVCDTLADREHINPRYVTLGSTCIVLQGESDGLEVYMANSNKEWLLISSGDGGGGSGTVSFYICSSSEYDPVTGMPTVAMPATGIFYLVPGGSSPDLFTEWVYVDEAWELFGSASVDLTNYVTNTDYASASTGGVVKTAAGTGITVNMMTGVISTDKSVDSEVKAGLEGYKPLVPFNQHLAVFYGLAKAAGDTTQAQSSNPVGTYTTGAKSAIRNMIGAAGANIIAVQDETPTDADTKIWFPSTAVTPIQVPTVAEMEAAIASAGKVKDVQINGTSILDAQGVAKIPQASNNAFGVAKINSNLGVDISNNGELRTAGISDAQIKAGTNNYLPIPAGKQHAATFYGLAKAAGDTTQSASANAVGTYTDAAKTAIQTMLSVQAQPNIEVISGTAATIVGVDNTLYRCGTVTTISITAPASGSIDVLFTSGSTAAVLTSSGITWPEWFDSTDLDTNTVYEINIADGRAVIATWPAV